MGIDGSQCSNPDHQSDNFEAQDRGKQGNFRFLSRYAYYAKLAGTIIVGILHSTSFTYLPISPQLNAINRNQLNTGTAPTKKKYEYE